MSMMMMSEIGFLIVRCGGVCCSKAKFSLNNPPGISERCILHLRCCSKDIIEMIMKRHLVCLLDLKLKANIHQSYFLLLLQLDGDCTITLCVFVMVSPSLYFRPTDNFPCNRHYRKTFSSLTLSLTSHRSRFLASQLQQELKHGGVTQIILKQNTCPFFV